jgi:hypothetical protein
VEGDALIEGCSCLVEGRSSLESAWVELINDAEVVLNSLQSWHVKHTKRNANIAAHHLAKATIQQP